MTSGRDMKEPWSGRAYQAERNAAKDVGAGTTAERTGRKSRGHFVRLISKAKHESMKQSNAGRINASFFTNLFSEITGGKQFNEI